MSSLITSAWFPSSPMTSSDDEDSTEGEAEGVATGYH